MKKELIKRVQSKPNPKSQLNSLRDELQHIVLQEIDRKGGFEQISFLGDTALRVIYELDRFSEDLDFSVSQRLTKKFKLSSLINSVCKSVNSLEIDCHINKLKEDKNVHSCFLVFPHLLNQVNKIFVKDQKLALKIDVDTNPPLGCVETISTITASRLYKVRHYDLPSLFAGKLHAILFRKYTKGRDLYDLLWYTGKGIPVNVTLLKNSIIQTQKKSPALTSEKIQELVKEKISSVNWSNVKKDVEPFLFDQRAIDLFNGDVFMAALKKIHVSA